jgi:ATP-dependent helicase HepA
MSALFHPGQRWVSETEPELGLGSIRHVTPRTVAVGFGATNEAREYSLENAPLRRVRFHTGDSLLLRDGTTLAVEAVAERRALIFYRGGGREVCETELSDTISFNKPEQRLYAGHVDEPAAFDLRVAALRNQHRRRKSKVRGFVGGRIDLVPHQLCIAAEVAGRLLPRVLLADEVGLGKTIEACLIVHRLILTGRAQRVLILVPDSLVHQWFVELLRRFNLWFHIFDEERCAAIEGTSGVASNPTPANRGRTPSPPAKGGEGWGEEGRRSAEAPLSPALSPLVPREARETAGTVPNYDRDIAETNPFLDDQLVLASLSLFTGNERRRQQALAAGWDMLVVDEAHHLGWTPDAVSPEYAVVEALGQASPGLLLLTATPEQLGMASHFARLRLLDPDRFYDLAEFIHEAEGYRDVARLADKVLKREEFTPAEVTSLAGILAEPEAGLRAKLAKLADGTVRAGLVSSLLDQHGTGRVMFRNTRTTISGFPRRVARLCPLDEDGDNAELFERLTEEFSADADASLAEHFEPDFSADPRVHWLVELLRALGNDKVLLICRTRAKAETLDAALRVWMNVKLAVFHEGLTLVQRDRHAAWFAEEDGARLLICSEIGSEGRNFQFAHHLVMFDLPLDPELLEQRIGRLDRIGQTSEIQLHLPFVVGSAQEVLVRWYHEGLNSFEKNLQGGRALLEQFGKRIAELAHEFHERGEAGPQEQAQLDPAPGVSLAPRGTSAERAGERGASTGRRTSSPQPSPPSEGRKGADELWGQLCPARQELSALIAETKVARQELTARLEQGRDRLLELNSFRPQVAAQLVQEIQKQDADPALDQFMLAVFDHFGIHVEELAPRTYQLGSAGVFADSFPGLPLEGLTVTGDRTRALSREDVQFLTWDHPLVTGALDLLLGTDKGNSSFGVWPDGKATGLYLEAVFLLECVAPSALHADRFLPPTPLRVLVDQAGNDASAVADRETLARQLRPGDPYPHVGRREIREELLPSLLEKAEDIVQRHVPTFIAQARKEMASQLDAELVRLKELERVNPSVRPEEIEHLTEQKRALDQHLGAARVRLEAIRLIQRG